MNHADSPEFEALARAVHAYQAKFGIIECYRALLAMWDTLTQCDEEMKFDASK